MRRLAPASPSRLLSSVKLTGGDLARRFNFEQKVALLSLVLGMASLLVSLISAPAIDRLLAGGSKSEPVVVVAPAPPRASNAEASPRVPPDAPADDLFAGEGDMSVRAVSAQSGSDDEAAASPPPGPLATAQPMLQKIGIVALALGLAGLILGWIQARRRQGS